jgi:hypothetical protein
VNEIGYIIQKNHVQLAIEKARPDETRQLGVYLQLVTELDNLERSFADRLQKARGIGGIKMPRLSKSAMDAASQSLDASQEFDRLLTRRCNRAESAGAVIQELLTTAEDELEMAEFLAQGATDKPGQQMLAELVLKKRELVRHFKEFIARESS